MYMLKGYEAGNPDYVVCETAPMSLDAATAMLYETAQRNEDDPEAGPGPIYQGWTIVYLPPDEVGDWELGPVYYETVEFAEQEE